MRALAVFAAFACFILCGAAHGEGFAAIDAAVRSGVYPKVEAVLVERNGVTVFEGYYRKTTAETRLDAKSAGKSITAMAVGAAIADGALPGVSARVFDILKEHAPQGGAKAEITIRDALTMTSAFDCDDWSKKSPGQEERMYRTKNWAAFAAAIPEAAGYQRRPDGLGRFSYCTAGVFLLGRVVERAVGEPFDAYVQRRLFDPLGIHGAVWRRSPSGEVQSGGQLSLRARDFLALGRLTLNKGAWGDAQVLPVDWVREMVRPVRNASPSDGYGYLWWSRNFKGPAGDVVGIYMSGNGGNKIVLFPTLGAVVTVLTTNYNKPGMHEATTDLIEKHILPELERAAATAQP